ncbi:MAG: FtsX-like permease family protein [Chloroflexi bacterium]|nr:FtsX-like permease family protein [Chloroflexota bacterium]
MSLVELLRTATRSVSANKFRAALTMLGVVIGVASVIAMLALGNGARAAVDATFKTLGANQIQIGQRFEIQDGKFEPVGKKLTYLEGLDMASNAPLVERVEMSVSKSVKARYGRNSIEINANGVTADGLKGLVSSGSVQPVTWDGKSPLTEGAFVGSGRFFTLDEVYAGVSVCVLGYQTALDLFAGDEPVGQVIWVNRTRCTVIGVLAELVNTDLENRYQSDPNKALLMPISTMIQQLFEEEPSVYMTAHIVDANRIEDARGQIATYLRERHQVGKDAEGNFQDDFDMTTRSDILGQQQEAARTFSILLAAMALVSLIVGGIGIMNVMMVSVTERTREIGVRMAVGAEPLDIVLQFLLEAVLISASGGLAGIVLGILAIPVAASLNNGVALLLPGSIPLAFGVALLTGVAFGLFPAMHASRLDPIEALRYE